MSETILIPFVDNPESKVYESRPHKIVLNDKYVEYFQWHKTNDIDEEEGVRKDFFVDMMVFFTKPSLIGVSCAFSNKDQLYHLILADFSGTTTIRFKEKAEAKDVYTKIKNWWLS